MQHFSDKLCNMIGANLGDSEKYHYTVNGDSIPSHTASFNEIYDRHRDVDGNLYINYYKDDASK